MSGQDTGREADAPRPVQPEAATRGIRVSRQPAAPAGAGCAHSLAIVIGIKAYGGVPPLTFAANDATRL